MWISGIFDENAIAVEEQAGPAARHIGGNPVIGPTIVGGDHRPVGEGGTRMGIDRRLVWALLVVLLVIVMLWALDHVLFPTLPVPAGAPTIIK